MSTQFHHNIYLRADPALGEAVSSPNSPVTPVFLTYLRLYWTLPRMPGYLSLGIDQKAASGLVRFALSHHASDPLRRKALERILEIGVEKFYPGIAIEERIKALDPGAVQR